MNKYPITETAMVIPDINQVEDGTRIHDFIFEGTVTLGSILASTADQCLASSITSNK